MCLIVFAYNYHPNYPLIIAANRDEFYNRATDEARFWTSYPWVLAGRDLEMFGTWMGITKTGRFAALTNYRNPSSLIINAKSRGTLVSNFLCNNESSYKYILDVKKNHSLYNAFNLLIGDTSNLFYFNKHSASVEVIKPGIHGLSNHFLNTPWMKVLKSKRAISNCLANQAVVEAQSLFEILVDTETASENELPYTGISREREKMLSSIFIQGIDYGTRSSTVILIDRMQHVVFEERSYIMGKEPFSEVKYEFELDKIII